MAQIPFFLFLLPVLCMDLQPLKLGSKQDIWLSDCFQSVQVSFKNWLKIWLIVDHKQRPFQHKTHKLKSDLVSFVLYSSLRDVEITFVCLLFLEGSVQDMKTVATISVRFFCPIVSFLKDTASLHFWRQIWAHCTSKRSKKELEGQLGEHSCSLTYIHFFFCLSCLQMFSVLLEVVAVCCGTSHGHINTKSSNLKLVTHFIFSCSPLPHQLC